MKKSQSHWTTRPISARMKVVEVDTSVSALVRRYLTYFGAGETGFQRLKRWERQLRGRVPLG